MQPVQGLTHTGIFLVMPATANQDDPDMLDLHNLAFVGARLPAVQGLG